MVVNVEASSYYGRFLDKLNFQVQIDEKQSVEDVLKILNIPLEHVGFVIVNNSKKALDFELKDNDTIEIFPYLIGG